RGRLMLLEAGQSELIERAGSCRAISEEEAGFGANPVIQELATWRSELEEMRAAVDDRVAKLDAALGRLEEQRRSALVEIGENPDQGYASIVTGVFVRMRATL